MGTRTRTGTLARLIVRKVMSRTEPFPSGIPRTVAIPLVLTQMSTAARLEGLRLCALTIRKASAAAAKTSNQARRESKLCAQQVEGSNHRLGLGWSLNCGGA